MNRRACACVTPLKVGVTRLKTIRNGTGFEKVMDTYGTMPFNVAFQTESALQQHEQTNFREIGGKLQDKLGDSFVLHGCPVKATSDDIAQPLVKNEEKYIVHGLHFLVTETSVTIREVPKMYCAWVDGTHPELEPRPKPCVFFFQTPSACKFGAHCAFSHNESMKAEALKLPIPPRRQCRHHLQRRHCFNGDSCKFLHQGLPGRSMPIKRCRYIDGTYGCLMGDTCPFNHTDQVKYRGWKGDWKGVAQETSRKNDDST